MAVLFSLIAYSLFGIGMVLMKYGADTLADPRAALRDPSKRLRLFVWAFGLVTNMSYGFVLMVALSYGKASVVGALNGFGLAVAAVLSYFLLRERITIPELGGIGTIILGTGVLGFFGRSATRASGLTVQGFFGFNGVLWVAMLVLFAYTVMTRYRSGATVFAIAGGIIGGLGTLSQKLFVTAFGEHGNFSALIGDGYFMYWLFLTLASFVFIQLAYQFGDAVVIVPLFSASIILTPVIGGMRLFGERLNGYQLAGVVAMLAGMVLVTVFKPGDELDPPMNTDEHG